MTTKVNPPFSLLSRAPDQIHCIGQSTLGAEYCASERENCKALEEGAVIAGCLCWLPYLEI